MASPPQSGFPYYFPFPLPSNSQGSGGGTTPIEGINPILSSAAVAFEKLATYLKVNAVTPKPNVAAFLQVFCNRYDELEDAFQALFFYRQIDNAIGQFLDDIGEIVGLTRNGLDDPTYQLYLKAKIAADNSSGTTEDINLIFQFLTSSIPGATWEVEWEWGTQGAAFTVLATGAITTAEAAAMGHFLQEAKGGGIRAVLEYGLSPVSSLFRFMSSTESVDGSGNGPTTTGQGLDQGKFAGALN